MITIIVVCIDQIYFKQDLEGKGPVTTPKITGEKNLKQLETIYLRFLVINL